MAIYALGDIEPRIHPAAYVHPLAVVIGNVELAAEASVWPYAVLRGDDGVITVGVGSNIQDAAVIHCTPGQPTVIGAGCTIGHQAHLEGCTVHDDSLIGVGAIAIHRASIGPHALVGANATVIAGQVVPPHAMAVGTPARIREDCFEAGHNQQNAQAYIDRGALYRKALRRLD